MPDALDGLARLRLDPGTVVILALSNGRTLLRHYFAVLLAGAVPLTVSPAASSARIARLAAEVGAGAVIAARLDPHRYGVTAAAKLGDAEAVVLARRTPQPPGTVLMLTSGTSGLFGACLHHVDSLVRNGARHADAVGARRRHPTGEPAAVLLVRDCGAGVSALGRGARLVISGPPFSPPAYRDILARHEVTSSSVTPTIARLLLAEDHKLPAGLRMLTVGGDLLAPAHVSGLLATNSAVELYVTYGLTEAGPRVSTLAAHREPASRFGSVGVPRRGCASACATQRSPD